MGHSIRMAKDLLDLFVTTPVSEALDTPLMPTDQEKTPLGMKDLRFLHEYAQDLDEEAAAMRTGLTKRQLTKMLQNPSVGKMMQELHRRIEKTSIEWNALSAKERFLENYQRLENLVDSEPRVAGALAQMARMHLEGTGVINKAMGENTTAPRLTVNINLDSKSAVVPTIDVTPENEDEDQ